MRRLGTDELQRHVEPFTANGIVGERRLSVAAHVDAKHATVRERADDASDADRGRVDVDAPLAASPSLGKQEPDVPLRDDVRELREHARDLGAISAAGDRQALHDVGERALAERDREVGSLGHVPRQRRVVAQVPAGGTERPRDQERVDERQVVRADQERRAVGARLRDDPPVFAARDSDVVDRVASDGAERERRQRNPERSERETDRTLQRERGAPLARDLVCAGGRAAAAAVD
jgi:hypothetical protein